MCNDNEPNNDDDRMTAATDPRKAGIGELTGGCLTGEKLVAVERRRSCTFCIHRHSLLLQRSRTCLGCVASCRGAGVSSQCLGAPVVDLVIEATRVVDANTFTVLIAFESRQSPVAPYATFKGFYMQTVLYHRHIYGITAVELL